MTKALTLNGEQLLDKTLRIEKAKEKTEAKTEAKTEVTTQKKKGKSKTLTQDQKGKHSYPSELFHAINIVRLPSDFATIVF